MTQAPPLATFAELRRLALTSAVARACIELRTQEIAWRDWDIVPDPALAQSLRGRPHLTAESSDRRAQALRWFRRPDSIYATFTEWLRAAIYEVLTVDALALYQHPPQNPGYGLLGGPVASLDLVDGAIIDQVLNGYGSVIGYVQYARHAQRRAVTDMTARPLTASPEALYGLPQMLYRRFSVRPGSPFGWSPLEQAIVRDEASGIDIKATEAELPGKFGLPPSALGIAGAGDEPMDRDGWLKGYLDWLAAIFNGLLQGSGFQWKWEETA